jgi:hypothetical protein
VLGDVGGASLASRCIETIEARECGIGLEIVIECSEVWDADADHDS